MPTRTRPVRTRRVPTPFAAAIGVVPAVLGHVRRLPVKAVQLPIFAVSGALTGLDSARREYESLADRGEQLVARLRRDLDEVEDQVEDSLQGTPLARPYDAAEDALEDAADGVRRVLSPDRVRDAAASTARTVGAGLDRAADSVDDVSTAATTIAEAAGSSDVRPADLVADVAERGAGGVADAIDSAADGVEALVEVASGAVGEAADVVTHTAQQAADTAKTAADTVTGAVTDTTDEAARNLAASVGRVGAQASSLADDLAAESADDLTAESAGDVSAEQAPKGGPTPKATQPDDTRIDTAASPDVVGTVEQISEAVGGTVLQHDRLPLPDYDHMTLGSLRGRMRSLDVPQLVQVRDYEKAHADRLPIVTMLDNRIAKLASDPTAPLSGSDPSSAPSLQSTRGRSKVSPATTGPKINPPSQGVPTNPQQPR